MPRCKNCRDKFEKKYFVQPFCMEKDECIKSFSEWVKVKKRKYDKDFEKLQRQKDNALKVEVYSKENRKYLQDAINKLSRIIDQRFGHNKCIDCNGPFGAQTDAAHFHGKGGNSSLTYNLHNLHSAASHCNFYSDTHKQGYEKGIKKRYGQEYWEMLERMPLDYPELRISNLEVYEKLKLVRKLLREFEKICNENHLKDGAQAREHFNNLIGIYKTQKLKEVI